jgi:hypothetical protein
MSLDGLQKVIGDFIIISDGFDGIGDDGQVIIKVV